MRISREDSTDLGIVMYALTFGAIDKDDVCRWASIAIDEEEDPPLYLYTMLDLRGLYGRALREEIGFVPGAGLKDEKECNYIRQIAVRRGLQPYSYLGDAATAKISPRRQAYINDLFAKNFAVDVSALPSLESLKGS